MPGEVLEEVPDKGYAVIKKQEYTGSGAPNLPDYEGAYKTFKWEDAEKEIEHFEDGKINAAYNAIDRHVKAGKGDKIALYWEGETESKEYTFRDLMEYSNKFANVLAKYGVKKGDKVFVFLNREPEVYMSFLGILKTGAIASTLFSAFGPEALRDRMGVAEARFIITDKTLLKRFLEVRKDVPTLEKIFLIDSDETEGEYVSYWKEMDKASPEFEVAHMDKDDPTYILFTSGSTGKPKGVVHAHGDIVQQHITAKWILNLKDDTVYWCTADPGWVTGIVYTILGSWSNAVTSVVDRARFNPERWYQIIERRRVSVWYTAPTAIRLLMKAGDELAKKYDLSSLQFGNSVGEPLNPEAVRWSMKVLGIPFHDNWWQTETGSIMIANYKTETIRLGSMGRPFPGIEAAIVDDEGKEAAPGEEGHLVVKPGWPSMMKSIWKNEAKYKEYFRNGWYITGDKAYVDEDGYFWFVGRADDVIKTAGERVGPFEVESALIEHPAVAEAGVIGKPDVERGNIIKAFLVLKEGHEPSDELKDEIKKHVKTRLAYHAYPREIEFIDKLPKTRSGKIMRRVLKARELGQDVGDISTMAED